MYAPLRRFSVVAIGLALLLPAAINSNPKPKQQHAQKHNGKKGKPELPDGIPSLWRQPADIAKRSG